MSFINKIKKFISKGNKDILNGYPNRNDDISNWYVYADSPDNDITEDLEDLRAKSRSLYMTNEIAGSILTKIKTSVVGTGLIPKPHIDYKYIGISKEEAKNIEKIIKTKFNMWATTTNADSTRMHDFYTLQSLIVLSWVMSGDVFVIPKRRKKNGVEIDLTLQILEADRVLNPSGANKNTKGGVEYNEKGEVINYYISNKHPGDEKSEIKSYKVFNSLGRRNILHIFEPERPGQRRGVPLLAPLVCSLKQLERYQSAEITSAVMNAMIGLIIEKEESNIFNNSYGEENKNIDEKKYKLKNAMIIEASAGNKIKEFQTTRPNKNYKDFVEAVIEGMGARATLPKEVLLSSFKSSYSAARAALEEANKRFLISRKILEMKFCQPVYEEFILELIKNGDIECPRFFEDESIRYAFSKAIWIGPNKTSLDPMKDARAAELQLKNRTVTRSMIALSQGIDFDDLIEELEYEEKVIKEIGGEKN